MIFLSISTGWFPTKIKIISKTEILLDEALKKRGKNVGGLKWHSVNWSSKRGRTEFYSPFILVFVYAGGGGFVILLSYGMHTYLNENFSSCSLRQC